MRKQLFCDIGGLFIVRGWDMCRVVVVGHLAGTAESINKNVLLVMWFTHSIFHRRFRKNYCLSKM